MSVNKYSQFWKTKLLSATPRGAFLITLLDAGLIDDIFDKRAEDAWTAFESLMRERKCFSRVSNEFEKKLP